MTDFFSNLGWLPRAPLEFGERVRSLQRDDAEIGDEVRSLASYALDQNQLRLLARGISTAKNAGKHIPGLEPFKLAVLSNATVMDLTLR